ncbi:MAG: hypothetical protein LUH19_03395 [Lachnospiraceae bacterium]|nr:hypothetical protein [Lachnospiraceae bacterium]
MGFSLCFFIHWNARNDRDGAKRNRGFLAFAVIRIGYNRPKKKWLKSPGFLENKGFPGFFFAQKSFVGAVLGDALSPKPSA